MLLSLSSFDLLGQLLGRPGGVGIEFWRDSNGGGGEGKGGVGDLSTSLSFRTSPI
jgi:hypothetical protein